MDYANTKGFTEEGGGGGTLCFSFKLCKKIIMSEKRGFDDHSIL